MKRKKLRFNNDYNRIGHEAVLKALNAVAAESFAGYGEDDICKRAADKIRELVACENAAVFFLPGATQANFIVNAAALSPIQSVICADTGHINCHEAASIENTGHKICSLRNNDGKLQAEQIAAVAEKYRKSGEAEYLTEPHLVYISMATELGTVYSLAELKDISDVCRNYGLLLFIDGARLGYALGAAGNDVTLEDIGKLADVFYIGGTKCGALFGEALVIINQGLQRKFKTYMKQNGAVLAKGWLLGTQFLALLEDGLYFRITKQADELAMQIRDAFRRKGIVEAVASPTNQQFVILSESQKKKMAEKFFFEDMDDCVRFCTSWATTQEEVDTLIKAIESL